MKRARFIVALLLSLSVVVSLGNVFAQSDDNTLVDVIARATGGNPPQFTAISAALQAADPAIGQALADAEQYFTVFAPADVAFSELPTAALGSLLGDQALLSGILSYHIVEGYYPSSRIEEAIANEGGLTLTTLTGDQIVISRNERGTFVNDSFLRMDGGLDYLASNGVIHIIEGVLFPASAQEQLGAILGGSTEAETTEEAEDVEKEAIPSTAEQVQSAIGRLLGASSSSAEAEANEEVEEEEEEEEEAVPSTAEQVQGAIGRLLGASSSSAETEATEEVEEEAVPSTAEQVQGAIGRLLGAGSGSAELEVNTASATLSELLVDAGNFEMLTMILANAATDYNTQLSEAGEYTVFAPTDDAFNVLASGLGIDLRAALAFPDILIDIVGYHVAEGIITGDALVDGFEFVTVQGESVTVSLVDGFIVLNGSVAISITDIEASNGVLHVVDGVLLPQSTIATFAALGLALPE
jgi:transforming growth factor-beta-induced protein